MSVARSSRTGLPLPLAKTAARSGTPCSASHASSDAAQQPAVMARRDPDAVGGPAGHVVRHGAGHRRVLGEARQRLLDAGDRRHGLVRLLPARRAGVLRKRDPVDGVRAGVDDRQPVAVEEHLHVARAAARVGGLELEAQLVARGPEPPLRAGQERVGALEARRVDEVVREVDAGGDPRGLRSGERVVDGVRERLRRRGRPRPARGERDRRGAHADRQRAADDQGEQPAGGDVAQVRHGASGVFTA